MKFKLIIRLSLKHQSENSSFQDRVAYSPKDVLYCSSSPQIFFAEARHRERGVGSRFRTSTRGLNASRITFSDSILCSYLGQLAIIGRRMSTYCRSVTIGPLKDGPSWAHAGSAARQSFTCSANLRAGWAASLANGFVLLEYRLVNMSLA